VTVPVSLLEVLSRQRGNAPDFGKLHQRKAGRRCAFMSQYTLMYFSFLQRGLRKVMVKFLEVL
jgi:hypothetical protein